MNFYVLEPEDMLFGTKWAYGEDVDPVVLGPAPRCPKCGRAVGMKAWLPPHRVKISSAKPEKWGDFLWGTFSPFMVSARFKAIYEEEGLSGIETFYPPAEVIRVGRRKTGDIPAGLPTYHLVKVPWDGANMDDEASEVVRKPWECDYCRGSPKRFERIVIERGSWNGADLFIARGLPGLVLASERFKEVLERHRLTNIWLIPSACYGYDEKRPGLWYVREPCHEDEGRGGR